MRTIIINGLLAAAALLPGIAQAQDQRGDRGDRGGWQRGGGDRPAGQPDLRPDRGPRPDRPNGDRPGGAPAPRPNWQNGPSRPNTSDIAPAPRPNWQGGGRPHYDTPGGAPAPRPNWQGGGRPHYDTPGGAPAPRPNWQGSGRPHYDTPGGAPAPRPNWQGGSPRGDRPGYDADDRRRDYLRRQQFQRNGNDWNDGFRNDNRFADRRDWNDRGWNRGWRNDSRYDWGRHRGIDRNRYHLPRYYAPYGWDRGYRRFSIGVTLSSVLFGQSYWIDDVYNYRLPPAYGPYRWVRYYNDALLVDVRSGIVVDTVYDIFW